MRPASYVRDAETIDLAQPTKAQGHLRTRSVADQYQDLRCSNSHPKHKNKNDRVYVAVFASSFDETHDDVLARCRPCCRSASLRRDTRPSRSARAWQHSPP